MSKDQKKLIKDMEGKTIVHIDNFTNYWLIHFSDGTKASLEVESVGHGLYGIIVS